MQRAVALINLQSNRYTEYVQQIIIMHKCKKSTVRLASVGLTQARPIRLGSLQKVTVR